VSDFRQQENLIAYLDGELTDEAAASVEKTLAEQVAARQEVEKLTRTWELLDLLPEGRASDGFTEKTLTAVRTKLATLTQTQTEEEQNDVIPGRGRVRLLGIGRRMLAFFVLLLVAAVGFNSTFPKGSEPIDELLIELPVVERLDEYQEVGDIEFLKVLEQSGMFDARHRFDSSNRPGPNGERPERKRD